MLLMLRRFCFVFFCGMSMNISQNEVLLCWNINWGMLEILRVYLSKHPFKVGSSTWEVFRNTPQTGACVIGHCRWPCIIVGLSEFWLCAWWKQVFLQGGGEVSRGRAETALYCVQIKVLLPYAQLLPSFQKAPHEMHMVSLPSLFIFSLPFPIVT